MVIWNIFTLFVMIKLIQTIEDKYKKDYSDFILIILWPSMNFLLVIITKIIKNDVKVEDIY